MKTCDWNDLKDGDIFRVPNAMYPWTDTMSFWPYPFQLFQLQRGSVVLHSSKERYRSWTPTTHKQAVEVYENMQEIPAELFVGEPRARVNSYTGSDPEIFVVRGKERKSILPAFQFLPTQQQAKDTHSGESLYNVPAYAYRDGFAAECFIQPKSCHGYFTDNLRAGLKSVLTAAQNFDRTAQLTIKNTFKIPQTVMDKTSDEDAALGCIPSLNAYGKFPDMPTEGREFRVRTAGGHVHLGGAFTKTEAPEIIKAIDVIAGIPSVALFASIDTPERRKFYGRAGEYRQPGHGLEYRTLSNAWLAAPEIAHLMLSWVRAGAKVGKHKLLHCLGISDDAVQDIINSCDVKAARKFVVKNIGAYDVLLQNDGVISDRRKEVVKGIVEGGIEAFFPDFDDLEKNWKLKGNWERHTDNSRKTWGMFCNSVPQKVLLATSM